MGFIAFKGWGISVGRGHNEQYLKESMECFHIASGHSSGTVGGTARWCEAVWISDLYCSIRLHGASVSHWVCNSCSKGRHPELKVGDVITFQLTGEAVATHRIVEVVGGSGGPIFRTKGDANDTVDGNLISAENIVGKVVFTIPYLGYTVEFIQTQTGRYAVIAFGAFLLLMLILPEVLFGGSKREKQSGE